ncbi:hypothetical protein IH86_09350 [Sphingobium yanoikuyae]|jgi:hypothetical protein|uniref:Uncharacterized protein n=2 Tax=Sphingobium yanoikuyae TaxID=13690 RepID=A0A085K6Q9_SPHYA|nr:hypothetical protein EBF16_21415 [Sphingobium yanoikuyae]KFD28405.1 hypothetical protein IH86_09350 [Sphingobium yanoikuyae]KZC77723.1 hypothetical protein AYR46_17075 [Sphingobium yanoikuyae]
MKAPHAMIMALPLCLVATGTSAAERQQPRAEIFTDLLKCREISDDKGRLACYDRQVGAMDSAAQRDEVVVLDKTELNKTRRTLFGFSFPKLPFLNDGDEDEKNATPQSDAMTQIEATIASAKSIGNGKWLITLEDGAEWMTTEAVTFRDPKPGMTIEIKRASMGGFMAKIAGRPVRMKRVG